MSTLPTAEELFIQLGFMPKENQLGYDIKTAMIEFAKLHVEAALKAACRKWDADWKESLVEKTYPLTNIK